VGTALDRGSVSEKAPDGGGGGWSAKQWRDKPGRSDKIKR
jgi:hypothetical protein